MSKPFSYTDERNGQQKFFETYLPLVDKSLSIEDVLGDYSDGVVRGNILEFKIVINDLNTVLFQTVKYLSSMRLKGKSIPSNIILVSLDNSTAYVFRSGAYLDEIEKVYIGGASTGNKGFHGKKPVKTLHYDNAVDEQALIELLRSDEYTKINIDENCIVGWAERFYRENPSARKEDFIGDDTGKHRIVGEIRRPDKLKRFINRYEGKDNEKFRYLMDRLNDFLQKKTLGAFYTHPLYAQKSLELLRQAIARVPEGNDYVIIDRCAGTGNLEMYMTDEELSHTIVSTLEYYEYKLLCNWIGERGATIIPPTEHEDTFNMGNVRGADALSEEYIKNDIIMKRVNDPHCTVILFENPPYADTTSIEHQKRNAGKKNSEWKNSWAVTQMREEVKGTALNDLGNIFIWSAFKYYLRQPTDSYIVFSPAKYWKANHLIDKRLVDGFAFNRRHFHTNIDACVLCLLWSNENAPDLSSFEVNAFDIDRNNKLAEYGKLAIKRIYSNYSQKYFDKRTFEDDTLNGIVCSKNGSERFEKKTIRIKPRINTNILGYMAVYSSGFDNPDNMSSLLVAGRYDGNGFYLRRDNYLEKLPMFAASRYITYNRNWTERARIMKSADGYSLFLKDVKSGKLKAFLYKCLLFTCMEPQNHIRSFRGSDGRDYTNGLCLDNTHGHTVASADLANMSMNDDEKRLLALWDDILERAKNTENYNPSLTYGLYQIKVELNTSHKDPESGLTIYDYPELNGHIQSLAALVKEYYNKEIVPILFEYEFLK